MELQYIIEQSKVALKYLIKFVMHCCWIYYFFGVLSKIFFSCLTFFLYFITTTVNSILKEIVKSNNTLCFDVLKIVYGQNTTTSYSDLFKMWKKKKEPVFDSCSNGLSTVLSRHCRKLTQTFNRGYEDNAFDSDRGYLRKIAVIQSCVNKISSVVSNFCNWIDPKKELVQEAYPSSLFDFFSFNKIENSLITREVPSLNKCEMELSNAINSECESFVRAHNSTPMQMGFVFNTFEELCFEQENDLSAKLCVDGLYSVITNNCVWLKKHSIIIDAVVKLSNLRNISEEDVYVFMVNWAMPGLALALFSAFLYRLVSGKVYDIWAYRNDFLKKYPKVNNDVLVVNSSMGNEEYAVDQLMNRIPPEFNVLGLDCEISSDTTNVRNGRPCPALLQIARLDGYCVIFQLKHMQKIHLLERILNNKDTVLVGVGHMHDTDNLKRAWGLTSQRCLDIRHLASDLGYKKPIGLKDLVPKVLGVNCVKNPRHGPWEALHLTDKQIAYAAQDAVFPVQIFMALNHKKICQKFHWIKRLFWSEKTYWKHTLSLWEKKININYNGEQNANVASIQPLSTCLPSQAHRSSFQYTYEPESISLSGSTASLLTFCRVCAVCGSQNEQEIRLKAIIPLEYRVKFCLHLPHYLDLCTNCRTTNQKQDFILRNYLATTCEAPYPIYGTEQLLSVRLLAKNILNYKNKLNEPSAVEILKRLSAMFQIVPAQMTVWTVEIMENMDCWPYSPHADAVCAYFKNHFGDASEEKMRRIWCDHFMHTMKPSFLPKSWKRFYNRETLLNEPYI